MLADEYSSFVHLLLVTSPFVLVTKIWEGTDPQWDTLLSGYLPLYCTEKHFNGTYMVSEERNPLKMSSRICKSVYCDLFDLSRKSSHRWLSDFFAMHESVSLQSVSFFQSFVSIWHCSYLWLWNTETNSGCCVLFDCSVSWGRVVSARFSSRGTLKICST